MRILLTVALVLSLASATHAQVNGLANLFSKKGGGQTSVVQDAPSRGPGVGPLSEPSPGPSRLKVTILSPATWDCPHCPGHRNQDWSGFDATFEKRDGLRAYPCTEWIDSRGVKRQLFGRYTPDQVRWSMEQTGVKSEAQATTPEAAPTPHREVVRVLALLSPRADETFVDYGCGDGRWCIAAAQIYGCKAVGVEIDPLRADDARRRVEVLGLSDQVQIITGDATTTEVDADVGVAYLYSDVLDQLRPKLERLNRFASYQHRVNGLAMSQNGDSWVWNKPQPVQYLQDVPQQSRQAYWGGRSYAYGFRGCGNPRCAMCNSINSQLYGRR